MSGQLSQTVMQVEVPASLIGKKFLDIFRIFITHRILCIGIYRTAQLKNGGLLPHVYLAPTVSGYRECVLYVYVCDCIHVYIYMCIYMCVCVCVCMCMYSV